MSFKVTTCVALLLMVVVGCGGTDSADSAGSSSTSVASVPTSTSLAAEETFPGEAELMPVADAAIADLAERLNVDLDTIEVATVEAGIWSDGSIGCPEPGMAYTQATVIGSRVVLAHGGTRYHYHQAGADAPFLCDEPDPDSFHGAEGDQLIPPPGYDE